MNWWNEKAMAKTIRSYRAAVKTVLAMGSIVRPKWNGHHGVFPSRFETHSECSEHLTNVNARHDSLFDYGRPKQLGHTNYFFRVNPTVLVRWEQYEMEPGVLARAAYTDDEGDLRPAVKSRKARMGSRAQWVTLEARERRYALSDWKIKRKEIKGLMDDAPEGVRKEYAEAYAAADKEAKRWEAAWQEIAGTRIPTRRKK
jgi:hypothetical protein